MLIKSTLELWFWLVRVFGCVPTGYSKVTGVLTIQLACRLAEWVAVLHAVVIAAIVMCVVRDLACTVRGRPRVGALCIRLLHKFPPFFTYLFSKNFNNQNNNTSINYVLSFIVHYFFPSFHQFVDSISPEILGSSLEEVVEPIFKMILIFEAKTPHFIWKAAEEMVIRRGEVWGIGRMLKDLPTKLLECHLDSFAVCGRELSWRRITWPCRSGLFLSNCLINSMQLGFVEILLYCHVLSKHFPVD